MHDFKADQLVEVQLEDGIYKGTIKSILVTGDCIVEIEPSVQTNNFKCYYGKTILVEPSQCKKI